MDLICFLSNAFIDLLSDVSNNVCYKQNKKNIISEHILRALQELHLDEYLPFLLSDDQMFPLSEILKIEKKNPDGLHFSVKQVLNEDKSQHLRDSIVNKMLQRLNDVNANDHRKRKVRYGSKLWMQGMTPEQIEEQQRRLLQGVPLNDESEEPFQQEGTSNESPSFQGVQCQDNTQLEQYWADYRANWIALNQAELDNDYETWVHQNIAYNIENKIEDGITDASLFKSTYTLESFYEGQYQQFLSATFPQQVYSEHVGQADHIQTNDEVQADTSNEAGEQGDGQEKSGDQETSSHADAPKTGPANEPELNFDDM